jgi:hypothetical protein
MKKSRFTCPDCRYADSQDKRFSDFWIELNPFVPKAFYPWNQGNLKALFSNPDSPFTITPVQPELTLIHLEAPYLCLLGGGISAWVDDIAAPSVMIRFDGQELLPIETMDAAFIHSDPYKRWKIVPQESPCVDCEASLTGVKRKVVVEKAFEIQPVYKPQYVSFSSYEHIGIDYAAFPTTVGAVSNWKPTTKRYPSIKTIC